MSIRIATSISLLLFFGIGSISVAAENELNSMEQKFSYTIGYTFGRSMLKQAVAVDKDALIAAIEDVFANKQPRFSKKEMAGALNKVKDKIAQIASERAQKNLEAGKQFMEENKKKDGVVVLPNGIQYLEMVKGEGGSPNSDSDVIVNYVGTRINGTVFDSSKRHGGPATFSLARVIPGFRSAISLMQQGSKWQVFIPPEQAYGVAGSPPAIKSNETLIFEMELVSFSDAKQAESK